jgi:hypothetical protein
MAQSPRKKRDEHIYFIVRVSTSSGLKLSRQQKTVTISKNPDLIGMFVTQAKLVLIHKTVIIFLSPKKHEVAFNENVTVM